MCGRQNNGAPKNVHVLGVLLLRPHFSQVNPGRTERYVLSLPHTPTPGAEETIAAGGYLRIALGVGGVGHVSALSQPIFCEANGFI